jgi:hypothetical protein
MARPIEPRPIHPKRGGSVGNMAALRVPSSGGAVAQDIPKDVVERRIG